MNISSHAQTRIQQRGIPPLILNWLIEFGAVKHTHGARKRFFDKRARARLAQAVGDEVVNRLGSLLNVYLVESEETIVTTGHRLRRVRR
jgi:hypothetical protein